MSDSEVSNITGAPLEQDGVSQEDALDALDAVERIEGNGAEATDPLAALVESFRVLPGVGERTARRMAYHLLQHDPEGGLRLATTLDYAINHLQHCELCNSFTLDRVCATCRDPMRDRSLLCVVETPIDQTMIEASHSYHGLYYVLVGKLQPLKGVGGQSLSLERLIARCRHDGLEEVILATNFTTEGETTAHYLSELLAPLGIKLSRLARGVPAGSELEYVDAGTIAWALTERRS